MGPRRAKHLHRAGSATEPYVSACCPESGQWTLNSFVPNQSSIQCLTSLRTLGCSQTHSSQPAAVASTQSSREYPWHGLQTRAATTTKAGKSLPHIAGPAVSTECLLPWLAGSPCPYTDASQSWPALVAPSLNATAHLIGWSGAGLTNGGAANYAIANNIPFQVPLWDESWHLAC